MAENIYIPETKDRKEIYEAIHPQLKALMEGEADLVANLANMSSVLKSAFGFFWVGFYMVKGNELVLGPFQGTLACTRIAYGKGVCGTSWKENRIIVVEDVESFPGHIACSSLSKSEIVVPHYTAGGQIDFVLDVDSDKPGDFSEPDSIYLKKIIELIKT